MRTEIVYSDVFRKHDTIGHPENAERTLVMMNALKQTSFHDDLTYIDPPLLPESMLYDVHNQRMIYDIKKISETKTTWLDLDTYVCKNDFDTSRRAVGGTLALAKRVVEGKADNGFAIVRPPGHHATPTSSMGFCLFNNASITAYQLAKVGYKILIFDPDVHHGNGTQEIFYHRDDILYQSFHVSPHFPGTGKIEEIGRGKGKGFNMNAPLAHGNGESAVQRIIDDIFLPTAEEFNPDLILVSSGFDSHHSDRLGGLRLTVDYFGTLLNYFQQIQPNIVCTLEGGYNLDWIGKCLISQVGQLAGFPQHFKDSTEEKDTGKDVYLKLKKKLKPYWRHL
jgi:acetoin utilization deacetylase AcuC-like enzyme